MLWKVKVSDSWFGYVLVILLNIAEVFAKTVAKLSSCFANVQLLAKKVQVTHQRRYTRNDQ